MTPSRYKRLRNLKSLMARISVTLVLLAFVVSAKTYEHRPEDGVTFYTFNCKKNGTAERWCGVDGGKWNARSDRIIYYNYTVRDEIVIKNITEVTHINNCTGATSSDGCRVVGIDQENNVDKVRNKSIIRGAVPSIISMSDSLNELGLSLIHTDNFNSSGQLIQDTYPLLQDKHWQLNIPKGCRMKIIFTEFDLQSSPSCEKDFFSVQTSKNQENIHKYCHNINEIEIRRRRRVQLTMHSDEAIARRGIHASLCISNLPDQTAMDQAPCSCRPVSKRSVRMAKARAARSEQDDESTSVQEYKQLKRMRIAEEDKHIAEWLRTLMREGQAAIDRFIEKPVNRKQRLLAEHYQLAIQRAAEERTSLQ